MVVAMAAEVRAVEVRGAMRAVEATVEEAKWRGWRSGGGWRRCWKKLCNYLLAQKQTDRQPDRETRGKKVVTCS